MIRLLYILALSGLCLFTGCTEGEIVAKCGDFEVNVDELRFEVEQLGPSYQFDATFEDRLGLIEGLVARYVLSEAAIDMGMDEGLDQVLEKAERTATAEAYYEWKVERSVRVPRISSLKWRPMLDRRLYIKDAVFRARGIAELARLALLEGATYEDLQEMYRDDAGVVFVDVGWKVWKDLDKAVSLHIFPLEVGEFSDIVSMIDGYHIMYLADSEELGVMDEVLFLRARKFEKMVDEEAVGTESKLELMKKYRFRFHEEGVEAGLEAFAMSLAGDRPGEDLLTSVIATYDGGEVTVADIYNFYWSVPPESRFYPGDAYALMRAARDHALPELYAHAGYDLNLDGLYRVKREVRKAGEDYLVPMMEDYFRVQIEVTDEDMQDYYAERKQDLVTSRSYRARRILVETEDEMRQVVAELRSGRDFASVAEEHSRDVYTVSRGGDLGEIAYGVIAAYDSVVDVLQPGEISQPFTTEAGLEILQLVSFTEGVQLPYEEAIPYMESFIRNAEADEMLNDFVSRKKQEWGYYLNEDLLGSVWLPEQAWRQRGRSSEED